MSRARAPFGGAVLVTGNPGKLEEARRLCGDELAAVELELPEIQSLDLDRVLDAKGREARRRLGRAVIVEETGLYLEALNGFPGPLVKWMLAAVGPAGIADVARALGNPTAAAVCGILCLGAGPGGEVRARGETRGRLVLPPRGAGGFGWDPVFEPEGAGRTYGEMAAAEKDRLGHRGRAWRALAAAFG